VLGTEIEKMLSRGAADEAGASHVPVLGAAVVELLRGACGGAPGAQSHEGWVVDGTLGLAGHAELVLDAFPGANLLGLDQDPEALEIARVKLARFGRRARVRPGRLSELSRLVRKEQVGPIFGVLLDLGVSSLQLDRAGRGFSFQHDGPLDMRMDPSRDRTAAHIVNTWDESDLADLLYYEGGETRARQVARAIVEARRRAPFLRTAALADTIAGAAGASSRGAKIHPATRAFQALRRAVNEEGEELLAGLSAAEHLLPQGGRLIAIAFHSGEDREIKRFLSQGSREGRWSVLTRKPVEAGETERRDNPRSRSAKLRAGERTARASATPAPDEATADTQGSRA
jgi:16S rRNA (cytosine1402-N4)-methyltransferase